MLDSVANFIAVQASAGYGSAPHMRTGLWAFEPSLAYPNWILKNRDRRRAAKIRELRR